MFTRLRGSELLCWIREGGWGLVRYTCTCTCIMVKWICWSVLYMERLTWQRLFPRHWWLPFHTERHLLQGLQGGRLKYMYVRSQSIERWFLPCTCTCSMHVTCIIQVKHALTLVHVTCRLLLYLHACNMLHVTSMDLGRFPCMLHACYMKNYMHAICIHHFNTKRKVHTYIGVGSTCRTYMTYLAYTLFLTCIKHDCYM